MKLNKLDQIKQNLANGMPIDSDELLEAIGEIECRRDELKAHCEALKAFVDETLADYRESGADEGVGVMLLGAKLLEQTPKQSLEEIQAKAISSFELDEYYAGLLPENPDMDYVRTELARSYDFYSNQLHNQANK